MEYKIINIRLEEGLYIIINFEEIKFFILKNTIFLLQNIYRICKSPG